MTIISIIITTAAILSIKKKLVAGRFGHDIYSKTKKGKL